jgi:hypothetical protein
VAAILLGATARSALAAAPYVDGIADQNLGQWQGGFADNLGVFDESFTSYFQQAWVGTPPSHILYARFVTAPDVIAQGGACEQNLLNWYEYVTQTAHLIPVIAVWDVGSARSCPTSRPGTSRTSQASRRARPLPTGVTPAASARPRTAPRSPATWSTRPIRAVRSSIPAARRT